MSSSVSSSDWFSDLLCCEEAEILRDDLPDYYSPNTEFPEDIEESIAGLIEDEGEYMPRFDYQEMFQSQTIDASARSDSIAWILKVQELYQFQPLTAYLSVNYMDRFLSSRCLPRLPKSNGWLMQLVSVASLSLAAKMEEPLVPSLFDIQVEGTQFIFEPKTIRRMEFIILNALDWRLRSITPFDFVSFFAKKVESTGTFTRFIASHATQSSHPSEQFFNDIDVNFLHYRPSSIAAAAVMCAANEYTSISLSNPGVAATWCIGLSKEKIVGCYKFIQEVVVDNSPKTPPKEVPQRWVLSTTASDLSSSSLSSSSTKRRKLNNWLWPLWADEERDKS
ncbi:hypothetical protein IFM89_026293 [Coptis chinensis]|uniref:Cyclin N-terminal domain-containing protein n=1 Tax=Coptis chinensis TaxID=261450 RepID=A0A835IYF1_9MAGN|nr:hypothetical protein IFM89_026293 [Coptis chinensis]